MCTREPESLYLGAEYRHLVIETGHYDRSIDAASFQVRLNATDDQVSGIVEHALDPSVRVDTTLRELFPDGLLGIR